MLLPLLIVAGCSPETRIIVVPAGQPLIDQSAIRDDLPDFDSDVTLIQEGIAKGERPSNYENPIIFYYFAELENTSLSSVYHLDLSATLFYEDGSVWGAGVEVPTVEIFPGERIAVFRSIFNENDKPAPGNVESSLTSGFSRGVTQDEVFPFGVENVTFRPVGVSGFSVSGEVVNRLQRDVPVFRVQAWCTDSDGGLHGIEGADRRDTIESPLGPGEKHLFEFSAAVDPRVQVESCSAAVMRFVG